jgi:hypothetical protein
MASEGNDPLARPGVEDCEGILVANGPDDCAAIW